MKPEGKHSRTEKQVQECLGRILRAGSERYPYARTFAGELFGMTPDDYRLDGWSESAPHTMKATLQHMKSILETNMKKSNVGEVFGAVYGAGYHKAVNDVIALIDDSIKAIKEDSNERQNGTEDN